VATVVANTPDLIEFKNILAGADPKESPTVVVQAGSWDAGGHSESGVVVDVYGSQAPLLTPADARKLAKWLNKAADELEGPKANKKPGHKQRHYEDEDDDNNY
jgi:hypothetical protein